MKQLLVMALLVIGSFSAQAQPWSNSTSCNFEYRSMCISTITCTATPTSGWLPLNATSGGFLFTGACGLNTTLGYEVRYAAPASCTTPTYLLKMRGTPFCGSPIAIPDSVTIPVCGGCSAMPSIDIIFDQAPGSGAPQLTIEY